MKKVLLHYHSAEWCIVKFLVWFPMFCALFSIIVSILFYFIFFGAETGMFVLILLLRLPSEYEQKVHSLFALACYAYKSFQVCCSSDPCLEHVSWGYPLNELICTNYSQSFVKYFLTKIPFGFNFSLSFFVI